MLLGLAAVLSTCGEDGDARAVVAVFGLPTGSESLQVRAVVGGVRSNEAPVFAVQEYAGLPEYSFALRLPGTADGQSLFLMAEALDPQGCLMATGSASSNLGVHGSAARKLELTLAELTPRECSAARPILRLPTPSTVTTAGTDLAGEPARILLRGWGFVPGTRVTVEGEDARGLEWRSASELSFLAPIRPGRLDEIPVSVTTPEGTTSQPLKYGSYGFLSYAASVRKLDGLYSLYAQDLNQDSAPDLVIFSKHSDGRRLNVLLNDGKGGFPESPDTLATDPSGVDFLLADLTEDGRVDAVVVSTLPPATMGPKEHSLTVHPGDGRGHFGPAQPSIPLALGANTTSGQAQIMRAAAGDVDADRHVDLVLVMQFASLNPGIPAYGFLILMNRGQGRFDVILRPLATDYLAWGAPSFLTIRLDDIDGDGSLDVATNEHYLLNRRGAWTLVGKSERSDADLDGRSDLILDGVMYPNKGDLVLGSEPVLPGRVRIFPRLRAGNANGDGFLDYAEPGSVYPNPGVEFYEPVRTIPLPITVERCEPSSKTHSAPWLPIDLNKDGKDDVMYLNNCTYQLALFLNQAE